MVCFFVSYCSDEDIEFLKKRYNSDDVLIGVDQGADVLYRNGLKPDFVIGDFDSLQTDLKEFDSECEIIALNTEKDQSDLEYAMDYFVNAKCKMKNVNTPAHQPIGNRHYKRGIENVEVVIINSLQGRIDHIMSTMYLIEKYPQAKILSAQQEVFWINKDFISEMPLNTCLSLLPISSEVKNVTTSGLYYSLNNETLHRMNSRGISNKSVDNKVMISYEEGKMIGVINYE